MKSDVLDHINKYKNKNNRISMRVFFQEDGMAWPIVIRELEYNKHILKIFTPYLIEFSEKEKNIPFKKINKWLKENTKYGWMLIKDDISFVDKEDACLFYLFKESLLYDDEN